MPATASAQATCSALAPPSGGVVDVTPAQVGNLQSIVDSLRSGDTVQLADGVYALPRTLVFRVPGVTLRSKSGNRDGVVLDGAYATGDVILIQQSNVTIADLTLTRAYYHLVHVVPESAPLTGTLVHNVRGRDGSEQFIKVNSNGAGQYADNGVVRCSFLEMTDAGRPNVRNSCYTGGIDMHEARGWQIYDNRFSGFWCNDGLSEHAINLWKGSRDTQVTRNVVVNSARGIGFGLGLGVAGRNYSDAPCGGALDLGHYGGSITNNFVVANDARLFASPAGFDVGIGLEQSCETNVLHNTVISTSAPHSSSIEWRFANTSASVANNLVSHNLLARDGGAAITGGNVSGAPLSLFVNVAAADLHLLPSAVSAIDKAVLLATPVTVDIDREARGTMPDVGADEYYAAVVTPPPPPPPPPPAGDTQAPTVSVVSPVNGAKVSKPTSVTVAASDNVAVTRVELYVDGARIDSSTSAPFTMKWNPKNAATGAHTLQAKAYDAAGNVAASQPVTVYR